MERLDETKLRKADDSRLRKLRTSCWWGLFFNLTLSAWLTAAVFHDWWEYWFRNTEDSLGLLIVLSGLATVINAVCLRDYILNQEDLRLIRQIMEERNDS